MKTLASYRCLPLPASLRIARGGMLIACLVVAPMSIVATADEPLATTAPVEAADKEQPRTNQAGDALDQAFEAKPAAAEDQPELQAEPEPKPLPHLPPPEGAKRLSKTGRAWIDKEKGVVYVDGRISLRRGLLEMFACPPNTKEHESIVSVECEAFVIHAALLAAGAETGTPVQFSPEYKPPTGTEIEIQIVWKDADGKKQKARAQHWVRDARTQKPMDLPWVFAGSGFWHNEETGGSGYMAEEGDLVCLANFSTAMLDVPARATNSNAGLLYEAFTERVPPLGWPVRLVFKPVLKESNEAAAPAPPATSPQPNSPPRTDDE